MKVEILRRDCPSRSLISIRSARVGGDQMSFGIAFFNAISIHSARVGGDIYHSPPHHLI